MTTTFKENILKYVTGNITPGEEQANAFRDNEETQTSIIDALSEKGITATHFSILTTSTTSNYLIYGGYTSGGVAKGFVICWWAFFSWFSGCRVFDLICGNSFCLY